tara:strand:+ start:4448 stop:6352 length:1905 start_codon:yes stop_codon:yes gene_type:complete
MKIAYKHISNRIKSNPSIDDISSKLFQLGHEHEINDGVFDIEITPNRGDCLSVQGILRDLAVYYDVSFFNDIYEDEIDELSINFTNKAKLNCPCICFLKIDIDNDISSYTGELKEYFSDLDVNKNNFFTDISNYISYETGQPTHCYDLNKIGETFLLEYIEGEFLFNTLTKKQIKLVGKNLVFTKEKEIINLAGIMGGESTSCDLETRSVLIESAYFDPESIIGKSLKYNLCSDAAYKFERGVDPNFQEEALRRFIKIVSKHSNIKNIQLYKSNSKKNENILIPFNVHTINNIIGIEISEKKYSEYLTKLGFKIQNDFIEVPSFRSDVKSQNDLAEEIARVIGFDNIPFKQINFFDKKENKSQSVEDTFKNFLIDNGFYEVINDPFVSDRYKNSLKIDNPLDVNKQYLRTNLKQSLINNLLYNERRQNKFIKFFELSDIYTIDGNIQKKKILGIIASGRVGKNYKDFNMKIDSKYLAKLFNNILIDNNIEFESIPRENLQSKSKNQIFYLEVNFDEIINNIKAYEKKSNINSNFVKYLPISEFPKVYRDLSFLITNYESINDLNDLVLNFENKYLKDTFIFDFFDNTQKGFIKIGYRFSFQSRKKTLVDEDVNIIINELIDKSSRISGIKIPGL